MADKRWQKNDDGSESTTKVRQVGDVKETHHLTTAGGGTRKDHSHVVIREKADGTKSAHAAPRKSKR
jgi:hypothetical protein